MTTALAVVGIIAIAVVLTLLMGAAWLLWKFEGRGRW